MIQCCFEKGQSINNWSKREKKIKYEKTHSQAHMHVHTYTENKTGNKSHAYLCKHKCVVQETSGAKHFADIYSLVNVFVCSFVTFKAGKSQWNWHKYVKLDTDCCYVKFQIVRLRGSIHEAPNMFLLFYSVQCHVHEHVHKHVTLTESSPTES